MDSLQAFGAVPGWLAAAADAARVAAGMREAVPELRDGTVELLDCRVGDLRLKANHWAGRYTVTIRDDAGSRTIALAGMLPTDGVAAEVGAAADRLGAPGWRATLADPPLTLSPASADHKLPALAMLTDAAHARAWLEPVLAETWPGIQIRACEPAVARYRPGQRCTVICRLAYEHPDPSWPGTVVAKVHRRGEGAHGHSALQALAATKITGEIVPVFARPLAYVAHDDVAVQSHLPEDRNLAESIMRASTGDETAVTAAEAALRAVAVALATLHQAPVRFGPVSSLEEEIASARAGAVKLGAAFGDLDGALEPLLRLVERRAANVRPDPTAPSHGAFRPAQVRLSGDRVGLLDLDGFGQCEPAQDVGRFVAKLRLIVLRAAPSPDDAQALAIGDRLAAAFLERYRRSARVDPARVALWSTLDLAKALLQTWSRARTTQAAALLVLLDSQLATINLG